MEVAAVGRPRLRSGTHAMGGEYRDLSRRFSFQWTVSHSHQMCLHSYSEKLEGVKEGLQRERVSTSPTGQAVRVHTEVSPSPRVPALPPGPGDGAHSRSHGWRRTALSGGSPALLVSTGCAEDTTASGRRGTGSPRLSKPRSNNNKTWARSLTSQTTS